MSAFRVEGFRDWVPRVVYCMGYDQQARCATCNVYLGKTFQPGAHLRSHATVVTYAPTMLGNATLRLAVCLVGYVRTLVQPNVHNSIAHGFRAQADHVDFFGVLALGGNDTAKGQWRPVTRAELAPALDAIRPVAWEEAVPDNSPPPCGMHCMRQFTKFDACTRLVEAHAARTGARYDWVAKARPDVAFAAPVASFSEPDVLRSLRPRLERGTVYKDATAGDMLVYIDGASAAPMSRALAAACASPRPAELEALACTTVERCRCSLPSENRTISRVDARAHARRRFRADYIMSLVAKRQHLRVKYHRVGRGVHVVRTKEASAVMRRMSRQVHGDPMKALHNKAQSSDLWTAPADERRPGHRSTKASREK